MSIGKRPIKDIARLRPYLSDHFSDFVFRGTTLLHAPVEDVLYGFHFDARPGHGKTRWLHAFGLPLAVPQNHLSLGFGRRIPDGMSRGHDAFPVDLETAVDLIETCRVMDTEGLAVLSKWNSIPIFRQSLKESIRGFAWHYHQSLAVLAASQKDYAEAVSYIRECEAYMAAFEARDLEAIRRFTTSVNVDMMEIWPWEREIFNDVMRLLEPCLREDEEATLSLLNEWRAYTISKLGIEDLCV